MYIYFYFLVIFLLVSCFLVREIPPVEKMSFLLIFILLFVFSGFSYEMGPDWEIYEQLYYASHDFFTGETLEPFFIIISKIGGLYEFDKIFYQIAHTLFSLLFVYLALMKLNKHKLLMLFMYFCIADFYFLNLVGVRQALSLSMMLYALVLYLYFYKEKQALIVVFCGAMVHYSLFIILVCIPFIPLLKRKYSNSMYIILLLISFILYKIDLLGAIAIHLVGRYEAYAGGAVASGLSKILIYNITCLILMFSNIRHKDHELNFLFNYFFIGILIVNVFASNVALSRLWFYFELALLFLIPTLISSSNTSQYYRMYFGVLYFSFYFLYMVFVNLNGVSYQNYLFL